MSEEEKEAEVQANLAALRAKGGDAAELADLLEKALIAGRAKFARKNAPPGEPVPIIATPGYFRRVMRDLRAKSLRFLHGSKNDV